MLQWYASGALVDIIIGFTVLELLALWLYHRLTGRGLVPADYLLNGLAGLSLMVALRGAITLEWIWVGLGLVASGAAHFSDLWRRARHRAMQAQAPAAPGR
ncbi:MAG: hypothetical protein QE283_00820 [Rhodoferax sp.]|nr:hypothetical protein [Rhodoferax sp.]